ncbi:MAG: alpha-glucosidase/alpha-galactosidase, partial [Clostridia bacterium]
MKICFLGAGSTVFAKNILGDCILTPSLGDFHIALHDIDEKRLDESYRLITSMNKSLGGSATVSKHLNRREALMEADYIINAIQVGGYKPCTVTDFKIPAKYGLKQTIGDTLGIGGIMRGLRTFPVLEEFAKDIAEVCPNAYFLNYTNPMAMLTGYLLKHTRVKAVGLCHSVQDCVPRLFRYLGMQDKIEEAKWEIFGINHQAWLVSIKDGEGVDLYPTIKARSDTRGVAVFRDRVRREIMHTFGYYVTESSEHNAEYTPYFIKARYPGLILKYLIPINEYPRRCRLQILHWKFISRRLLSNKEVKHTKSKEYGSRIIEALHTGKPYRFHGSVLNTRGLVSNLPPEACVEVPIIADGNGLHPEKCG